MSFDQGRTRCAAYPRPFDAIISGEHGAMDRPMTSDGDAEGMSQSDIVALLSMIDYLIARIGRVDQISATCLILARRSLAAFTPHPPNFQ